MVYIGGLAELRFLKEGEDAIRIGALMTHAELASSGLIKNRLPVLAEACRQIGSPQVRNLATIGGNISWASPAADSAPALLALDARLNLVSLRGERIVPLKDFFRGPNKTEMQAGEILKEIIVPQPSPMWPVNLQKWGKENLWLYPY
jgi:CO/xanthine dehydrogenase FAD-binding subunit